MITEQLNPTTIRKTIAKIRAAKSVLWRVRMLERDFDLSKAECESLAEVMENIDSKVGQAELQLKEIPIGDLVDALLR